MKRISILIELVFACLLIPALKTNAVESGVFFNELAVCGSSVSSSDEWIELINTNIEEINLSDWTLVSVDKSQVRTEMIRIEKGLIEPGGLFIISNNSQDHLFSKGESTLAIDPDLIDSTLSLVNENITLELYNDENELVDSFGNGEKTFIKACTEQKKSFQRIDFDISGADTRAWEMSKSQYNLDKNIEDLGTPGFQPIFKNISIGEEFYKEDLGEINFSELKMPYSKDYSYKTVTAQQDKIIKKFKLDKEDLKVDLSSYQTGPIEFSIDYCLGEKILFSFSTKIHILESSGDIIINEVMANPSDESKEWIEMYNKSGQKKYLKNWYLVDDSGKIYRFGEIYIGERSYLLLSRNQSKISLNNSFEKISIISPNKNLIDQLEIPSSSNHQDESYGLIADEWKWLEVPSPGQVNIDNVEKEIVLAPEVKKEEPLAQNQSIDIEDESEKKVTKTIVKKKAVSVVLASSVIEKSKDLKILSDVDTNYHKRDFKFKPNMIYFLSINFFICVVFIYEIYRPKPARASRQNL